MGFESKIEWTDHTFNPWWGCTKASDGCKFCYALTISRAYGHEDVWGPGRPRRLLSDNHWQGPVRWNETAKQEGIRYRVFCASMADIFEEEAPEGQLDRLWELIRNTPNLDWQLLTKRPHRINNTLPADWGTGYDNVWLGTSVEDSRVLNRINSLVQVPAKVHFLSLEPLIGPMEDLPLTDIEWVIVGGESGPGARPMNEEWVLDIRDQCQSAQVPFFFKQWGGVHKKETGRQLQGEFHNNMPLIERAAEQNEQVVLDGGLGNAVQAA